MNPFLVSMHILLLSMAFLTAIVDAGTPQGGTRESLSQDSVGDSKRGKQLYRASCIVCHGQEAMGHIGPRLAGNPIVTNEPAFRKILHEGRHVMPPLQDTLSEQQMADILAWLRTLR